MTELQNQQINDRSGEEVLDDIAQLDQHKSLRS